MSGELDLRDTWPRYTRVLRDIVTPLQVILGSLCTVCVGGMQVICVWCLVNKPGARHIRGRGQHLSWHWGMWRLDQTSLRGSLMIGSTTSNLQGRVKISIEEIRYYAVSGSENTGWQRWHYSPSGIREPDRFPRLDFTDTTLTCLYISIKCGLLGWTLGSMDNFLNVVILNSISNTAHSIRW